MTKLILAASAAAFVMATGGALAQQTAPAAPPPKPQNLQVLPADLPRERLIAIMRSFNAGLGVECTFCHVGTEGKMEFASDANPHKNIARAMMRMTRRINEEDFKVTDFSKLEVSCYTCHRGAAQPLTEPPKPDDKPAGHKHSS